MAWNIEMPVGQWLTSDHPGFEAFINEILTTKVLAIDTETTGLEKMTDYPLYYSLCWGENRFCLPASTLAYLAEAFHDPDKTWVFANAKFDMHMLANVGVELAGKIHDTAVMHALLFEEKPHSLEFMSTDLLGWTWKDGGFKKSVGMVKGETAGDALRRLEATNPVKLVDYASNDAYGTFKVYHTLKTKLEGFPTWSLYPDLYSTMWDIFHKVEAPFTRVLWNCEREGILVNREYLQQIQGPMEKKLQDIERQMSHLAGRIINPNSPTQMSEYYFGELKLKPRMLTKGGKSGERKPSIDDSFLEYYEDKVPMAEMHRAYRELKQFHGLYVIGLQKRLDHEGRAHTKFNQDIARTGRLSSSDPNLQNIKRPDEDEFKLRGAFIAPPGTSLIVADYEQLEMRLLAAASMEPKMIDIFARNWDIHMGNAALVFGKKHGLTYDDINEAKSIDKKVKSGKLPPEAMTDRVKLCLFLRQAAKSIGFGLNYGMKENKLARQIKVTTEEAKEFIAAYMDCYPAVSSFYEDAINRTVETGYSFTLLGKRRFLPEIISDNQMDAWQAERQAVNNEIQGTAANVAQMAMILLANENLKKRFGCRMLLQVHDELVFQCPKETIEEVRPIIKERMEHPFPTDLAVHLGISMGVGENWMDAK